MQTSATGICKPARTVHKRRGSCGYTLIEIIVVLFIIGIAASMVMPRISLDRLGQNIDDHTRNITNIIRLAENESILRGQVVALSVTSTEVSLARLKEGKWVSDETNKWEHYRVMEPIKFDLTDHVSPITAAEDEEEMPVIFLPDGQKSYFKLSINNTELGTGQVIILDYEGLSVSSDI